MKGTIKLSSNVKERDLVEHCLNLSISGYESNVVLFIYALGKSWHKDKFTYYNNLIETAKDTKANKKEGKK